MQVVPAAVGFLLGIGFLLLIDELTPHLHVGSNKPEGLQARQVFTVHHDKFALSIHPWSEPDRIAHDIATKHNINLLDAPIGTVVKF